ncbi:hypothetical protein ACP70R_007011 [Stipagrostis hirtigluma subsp. patula]
MRCAAVVLALLLYLSALSASTAEAHKEWLGDNAMLLAGRKWLRVRKIMAAPGHGDEGAADKDEVKEGKGAQSTGANTVHVHGGVKSVEVVVGLSGEGTGHKSGGKRKFAGLLPFRANQKADAPAEVVNDQGKTRMGSASHVMFQEHRHGSTAATVADMLSMDYKLEARRHRPINNDAPLDMLAKNP